MWWENPHWQVNPNLQPKMDINPRKQHGFGPRRGWWHIFSHSRSTAQAYQAYEGGGSCSSCWCDSDPFLWVRDVRANLNLRRMLLRVASFSRMFSFSRVAMFSATWIGDPMGWTCRGTVAGQLGSMLQSELAQESPGLTVRGWEPPGLSKPPSLQASKPLQLGGSKPQEARTYSQV